VARFFMAHGVFCSYAEVGATFFSQMTIWTTRSWTFGRGESLYT